MEQVNITINNSKEWKNKTEQEAEEANKNNINTNNSIKWLIYFFLFSIINQPTT